MKRPLEIWRSRLWVWVPAALFLLANIGAFSIYRLGYSGRIAALEATLEGERKNLETERRLASELGVLVERARSSRIGMERLYQERFSTRKARLTEVTAEVKQLAKKAGLDPQAISYPEERIEDYGLIRRSFIFSVQGDYLALRRLLNLLELSDSFLTLEEVKLSEGGGGGSELEISLSLSTLFARDPDSATAAAPRPRASEGPTTQNAPTTPRTPADPLQAGGDA
jgi:uncharacterized protein YfcZ (UPF0381/DUF406 family)